METTLRILHLTPVIPVPTPGTVPSLPVVTTDGWPAESRLCSELHAGLSRRVFLQTGMLILNGVSMCHCLPYGLQHMAWVEASYPSSPELRTWYQQKYTVCHKGDNCVGLYPALQHVEIQRCVSISTQNQQRQLGCFTEDLKVFFPSNTNMP